MTGAEAARRWAVMAAALALDLALGDPPNRWHPVAWMGRAIAFARRAAPSQGRAAPFVYGLAVAGLGAAIWGGIGWALARLCRWLPTGWLIEAAALKQTVALRGLSQAAQAVAHPLAVHDLPEARRQLSWHLVSRETSSLDAHQVAAAAIESVAENTSDGVIAPLFWYGVGGLPAALAYRWLNTLDAMWGYRDPAHEWLGKAGARADDLANWLPARLTALLLVLAAGKQAGPAWRTWRRDGHLTASPNAGQPMSAMAGALGVALVKVDHYTLGAEFDKPTVAHVGQAMMLMRRAVWLGVLLAGAVAVKQMNRRAAKLAKARGWSEE